MTAPGDVRPLRAARSTLLTSPVSQADFVARLVFFAVAPAAIVRVAAFFPVLGTLANVAIALGVCLAGEAVRARSSRAPWVAWLLSRELELEAYYRTRRPRPFLYYVFYPLLAPYWLVKAEARREFWLYKGYTLGSLAILVGTSAIEFARSWRPELSLRDYLPVFGVTLAVDAVLVLALLMPIATTVIGFHQSFRRGRLLVLLLVALASTSYATARVLRRRDPVVSYATRERLALRAAAAPSRARAASLAALRAAWKQVRDDPSAVEQDGKIAGEPLAAARGALEALYKRDETFGFDLWAFPKNAPRLLVLYVPAHRKKRPIWIGMRKGGQPIVTESELPARAFEAMRAASR